MAIRGTMWLQVGGLLHDPQGVGFVVPDLCASRPWESVGAHRFRRQGDLRWTRHWLAVVSAHPPSIAPHPGSRVPPPMPLTLQDGLKKEANPLHGRL